MKKLLTTACLCLFAAVGLQSCLDFNELGDRLNGGSSNQIPNGALPTEEMTYGDFVEEPYAEVAAKYVFNDPQYGIESIEFFGNGLYLIAFTGASQFADSHPVSASRASDGSIALRIDRKSDKDIRSQSENYHYGRFQTYGPDQFFVDALGTFYFSSQDGIHYTLTVYDNDLNPTFSTECIRESTTTSRISKEICRSWNVKNWEEWGYINGYLAAHSKFDGQGGYYEGDILDSENYYEKQDQEVRTVMFSPSGTYLSILNNGTIDVRSWVWSNPSKEELFCDGAMAGEANKNDSFTVRFRGQEARFYEDDTYTGQEVDDLIGSDLLPYLDEDIKSIRVIRVTTLRVSDF